MSNENFTYDVWSVEVPAVCVLEIEAENEYMYSLFDVSQVTWNTTNATSRVRRGGGLRS